MTHKSFSLDGCYFYPLCGMKSDHLLSTYLVKDLNNITDDKFFIIKESYISRLEDINKAKKEIKQLLSQDRIIEILNVIENDELKGEFAYNLIITIINILFYLKDEDLLLEFILFWCSNLQHIKNYKISSLGIKHSISLINHINELPFYTFGVLRFHLNGNMFLDHTEVYTTLYNSKAIKKFRESCENNFWKEYVERELWIYNSIKTKF
jgi:hypothetical protein